jgi:hypothetical protein
MYEAHSVTRTLTALGDLNGEVVCPMSVTKKKLQDDAAGNGD